MKKSNDQVLAINEWVEYAKKTRYNASQVPAEWHGWLHFITDHTGDEGHRIHKEFIKKFDLATEFRATQADQPNSSNNELKDMVTALTSTMDGDEAPSTVDGGIAPHRNLLNAPHGNLFTTSSSSWQQ
ncbi:hypothetical protein JHK86_003631 [Glycine max]|nr:hypothetical protein JHK86_003631 [Glycine max]